MNLKRMPISILVVLACAGFSKASPSLNGFEDRGLAHEGDAVQRHDLTRFIDQAQLKRAIDQKLVVRVPDKAPGFYLDSRIGRHASKNRQYYRYARPYTLRFLRRLGQQYQTKFHDTFMVSSLVRTCRYQERIAGGGNGNAAKCEETSHTTGATVDLHLRTMTPKGREWMRGVLLSLEAKGLILATEEHGQPVFHVMVLPPYQNYGAP